MPHLFHTHANCKEPLLGLIHVSIEFLIIEQTIKFRPLDRQATRKTILLIVTSDIHFTSSLLCERDSHLYHVPSRIQQSCSSHPGLSLPEALGL